MVMDFVQFKIGHGKKSRIIEKPVETREVSKIEFLEDSNAFRFVTRYTSKEIRKTVCSRPFNISGWYYRGKEMELEAAKTEIPFDLYKQFDKLGSERVVKTSTGSWYPLRYIDVVLKDE